MSKQISDCCFTCIFTEAGGRINVFPEFALSDSRRNNNKAQHTVLSDNATTKIKKYSKHPHIITHDFGGQAD